MPGLFEDEPCFNEIIIDEMSCPSFGPSDIDHRVGCGDDGSVMLMVQPYGSGNGQPPNVEQTFLRTTKTHNTCAKGLPKGK